MNDIEFLQSQLNPNDPELMKAIAATAGFVGYDLEAEAALLIPYFAGWRARVPSDPNVNGADYATWKVQLGYGNVSRSNWGSAEANIGLATAPVATQFQAPFLQQSMNGDVTYISMLKARGFDDPMNIEVSNTLSFLLLLEEYISLTGNNAVIGTPAPTSTVSTLASPATFAAGTWHFKVTALTNQGCVANASSNSVVGETVPSASIAVIVPSGGLAFLDVEIPAVPGAFGYKIYAEAAAAGGTFYLCDPNTKLSYRKTLATGAVDVGTLGDPIIVPAGQTWVNVDVLQITGVPANTQPTPPGSDGSANALVFEGLSSWCEKTTVYGVSGLTHYGVDMKGKPFTSVPGGIVEIDQVLNNLWTQLHISPSLLIGSPNTIASLGNSILSTGSLPQYQVQIGEQRGAFQGGIYFGGYTNKFIATMLPGQNAMIPAWAHPYIPDGTLLMPCEDIPTATYRYSRKGKAFSLEVLSPYTYWELARTDLSVPFALLWSETLKCHHPQAQAAIVGARVDK